MKKSLAAIALLGLALRLFILARGVAVVDRLFVPDDTYYTLAIARSLAHGLGPSADGITLTSGFQPLLAFVMVPVFWVAHTPDVPVYVACIIGSVADACSVFLLGGLAARIAGYRAGVATALAWSLSSIAIANALNGLETALSLSLSLALIASWISARKSGAGRAFAVSGVLAGLALLARIDALFLVALLGLSELARRRVRETLLAAGCALVVVAPWWLYCTIHFGSPVPASGAAVFELVSQHREAYLSVPWALGWAAGSVLGSPFLEAPGLQTLASSDAVFGIGLWAVVVLALVLGTRRLFVAKGGWLSPYAAFAAFALSLLLFYGLYLPALWFFRRYFAPVHAFAALAVGVVYALSARHAKKSFLSRSALWTLCIAGSFLVVKTGLVLIVTPSGTLDKGLHGAKGYREAAREVLALVPKGAVVGAMQSGALAYYAEGSPTVVGLDGVVDPQAARAVRERTLSDYAWQRGVTHFADWPYNLETFSRLSERATRQPSELLPVGAVKPQGMDRFEVSRVAWPAPPSKAPEVAPR